MQPKLKIKQITPAGHTPNSLPKYADTGASGMDIASAQGPITIFSGQRMVIGTGLYFELPVGYELQIRPRSGLAAKHGITVLNSPGTIDESFRGEVKIVLYNSDPIMPFTVVYGDRIAQAVLAKVEKLEIEEVQNLSETSRGTGGFGSTGVK